MQKQQVMRPTDESLVFTYAEGIIQFGMIIFFAASFTLAPLFSIISNTIDISVKMNGMMKFSRRRAAQGASGIGFWVWVMEIFAIICVPINISIMYFTGERHYVENAKGGFDRSEPVSAFQEWLTEKDPDWWTPVATMLVAVLIEHSLLAIKIIVAAVIPDVPDHVRDKERKIATIHSYARHDMKEYKIEN